MKRMTLIAAALCLIMIATVGAGVVAAKQTENPSQAGASSIYFYDVAPNDMHGKGKLQINLDTHTFVFNGQGFESQIELKARAADSSDYVVFATGKATPSGNIHIAGTWDADAAPVEVVGDYPAISAMELHNEGYFVAKLACYYSTDGGVTWTESSHSKDILIYGYGYVDDLADLGVPVSALVKMHAVVVAGNDKTGSEVFRYSPPNPYFGRFAEYEITGTTLNDKLSYQGIWQY